MGLRNGNTPSLKALALYHLGLTIQEGEHDSVVDARIPVEIYLKFRDAWEREKEGKFLFVQKNSKKSNFS
jgi:DNA polymerase III epsilon subunit-like protein